MGRRRVYPPDLKLNHQMGSSTSERKCHGLGFHEEHYTVVIGPEPWPWYISRSDHCLKRFGEFLTSAFCRWLTAYSTVAILILLLLVLNFTGSQLPKTNLEALFVHDFHLIDNASLPVAPWRMNGNLTVVFQARNPSVVVGFRHRYVTTRVSAFYADVFLGHSEVPRFSQEERSARNVSSEVVIREQCVNWTTAESLRRGIRDGSVALRVAVDARVKVKRLWWQRLKGFNLTCLVNVNTSSSHSETLNFLVGKPCTCN